MAAVDLCVRCGSFACYECVSSVAGTVCCSACVEKVVAGLPPGRTSRWTWVIAFAGLLLWPLALYGTIKTVQDVLLLHDARRFGPELAIRLGLGVLGVAWPLVASFALMR